MSRGKLQRLCPETTTLCRHGRLEHDDQRDPHFDQEEHGCARIRPRARVLVTRTTRRLVPLSVTQSKAGACCATASSCSRTPANCCRTATPLPPTAPPT